MGLNCVEILSYKHSKISQNYLEPVASLILIDLDFEKETDT